MAQPRKIGDERLTARAANLGQKLQSLPRMGLYAILFCVTAVPLFFTMSVPNVPSKASEDLFNTLMTIPTDRPVLIASDWTKSTRAESSGHFKALIRILMRRGIKFCIYSTADPQAAQVARDAVREINEERQKAGEPTYQPWVDWVSAGYFPGAEAQANAMENNFRTAFQDKKEVAPGGKQTPILQSPVLAGVNRISDFSVLVMITASKTSNITIERIKSVPLLLMVTGVMGPEMYVYYVAGQAKGLAAGLKGVYDVETLMNKQFPNQLNLDNGARYYPPLTFALTLLILAVVVGNLGMYLARRRSA